jgi:hypothetical protein
LVQRTLRDSGGCTHGRHDGIIGRVHEVSRPVRAADTQTRVETAATHAPSTTADALGSSADLSPPAILALQRTAGNAAVARMLHRIVNDPPADHQHTLPGWLIDAYDRARKARDDFVAAGKKGPIVYDPSKRNKENYYGGFDVEYDPAQQELLIKLRGAAEFVPGMVLKHNKAVAMEPSPATRAARDAINALPEADRATQVAKWHWSKDGGPDADDESEFLTKFKSIVEDQWSHRHAFHCTRDWWQDLAADVRIDVEVREGKQGKDDHMKILSYKVPKGTMVGQANVNRPAGRSGGAHGNVMTVNSSKVEPRTDDLLKRSVQFTAGTNTPTAAATAQLEALADDMPNPSAEATVETAGVTVTTRGSDDAARKARFDAISAILVGHKMAASRIAFVDGGAGDGADVVVGTGVPQISVGHESGHMFGLDDEYTGAGAYAPGKPTEHTKFIEKTTGLKGVMHAKSDSIMSGGRVVRPQHYATFLDALRLVTGMDAWALGPPQSNVTPMTGTDPELLWGEPMGPF